MKTIELKEENVLATYKDADKKEKTFMEKLFGDLLKPKNILERVKTYEDAIAFCPPTEEVQAVLNYTGSDAEMQFISDTAKRNYVAKVLRGDWVADFDNTKQTKWYCWFRKTSAGFGFSITFCGYVISYTGVGSRLCFPDEKTAEHFGRNFTDLHNAVLSRN